MYAAGRDDSPGGDTAFSVANTPDGSTIWVEWYMKYQPGFQWSCCANTGNSSYKTFDWLSDHVASDPGCQNRILMTVWNGPDNTHGKPLWSIYPEGTCQGSTGKPFEMFPNVQSNFTFTGGQEYHIIVEYKSAYGPNGRLRMFVNGALVSDFS